MMRERKRLYLQIAIVLLIVAAVIWACLLVASMPPNGFESR